MKFITKDMNIKEYIDELSSNKPIPGGGGAAALTFANASALLLMVLNLTIGKKKFLDMDEELKSVRRDIEKLRDEFLYLSDKDAEVFEPLSKAYKDKNTKNIDELLLNASSVAIKLIEKSEILVKNAKFLLDNSSSLVISDIGVAISLIKAGVNSALLNIFVNTRFLDDKTIANNINNKHIKIVKNILVECDEIYNTIYEKMKIN